MIFSKYSFPTTAEWETLKSTIQDENGNYKDCAVVEIGNICAEKNAQGECINITTEYAVDILWYLETTPEEFNPFEVFPNPIGVHTFAGCDDLYLKRFCSFNPNSPLCTL